MQDLHCAWLLLLFCAATRANYFLRVVQPVWSERFAAAHNENVWELYQGVIGYRRDCEGAAVVESPSSTWEVGLAELHSVPDCRVLGQLGRFTPTKERHPRIADLVGVALFRGRFAEGNKQSSGCSNLHGLYVGFDAPEQGCWGSRWRVQQLASAERQGGRVSVNVRVADLDLLPPGRIDDRKIEVVADGLPLLLSEGMGVHVTSVLTTMEQLCSKHDARRKTPTLSWPAHGAAERVWWCWVAIGGRWSDEARDFVSHLAKTKSRKEPRNCDFQSDTPGSAVGTLLACSAARSFGLSLLEHRGGFGVDHSRA